MIRVLIVDDHSLVRRGLALLLASAGDIELVGEATDGAQAIELVASLQPDVVLMDLSMPGIDGVAATRAIRSRHPDVRVVALTAFAERATVLSAIDAGAIGYVLKDGEESDLLAATRAASRGESPLSPRAAQALLTARAARPGPTLSDREHQVVELLVAGLTNREIGEALDISEKTVKTHLTRIYQRFELRSRSHALAWAAELGIGPPPDRGAPVG